MECTLDRYNLLLGEASTLKGKYLLSGLLLKKRIVSLEQILSFETLPAYRWKEKTKLRELLTLKSVSFHHN